MDRVCVCVCVCARARARARVWRREREREREREGGRERGRERGRDAQDARIARDNDAIKRSLKDYDEALERYIPAPPPPINPIINHSL